MQGGLGFSGGKKKNGEKGSDGLPDNRKLKDSSLSFKV